MEIRLKRAQADPTDTEAQTDLAYSYGSLGRLEMQVKSYTAAIAWLEQGVAILSKLDAEGKIAGQLAYLGWLKDQRKQLEDCKSASRAADSK